MVMFTLTLDKKKNFLQMKAEKMWHIEKAVFSHWDISKTPEH